MHDEWLYWPIKSKPLNNSNSTYFVTHILDAEAMFNEAGISVTRGTLSNWLIKAADLLIPLVKILEYEIQNYDIAYADETSLQALKEKGRAPTQKSYMWLFIAGSPAKRAFVYQYYPTRSHQVPADFFADFNGYLHADCYQAYVACFAHARRYFVDVAKTSKKEGVAQQVITIIGKLYRLEASLKETNASAASIFTARLQNARPVLLQLKDLLDQASLKVLPKSPLGSAVFYTLTHWEELISYLYDGRLEIDKNRSERSIKPFVIGRKNWLFHGYDIGVRAGATLFSLIETCKYHQIDTFSWFKYTLANIQQAHTAEQLEARLPYNIDPQLLINMRSLPDLSFPA